MPRAWAGKSAVISQAVSEWLRAEAHRGIVFVTGVTGERRALRSSVAHKCGLLPKHGYSTSLSTAQHATCRHVGF